MTVPSLEKVARKIFGAEDPESVERWVRYGMRARNEMRASWNPCSERLA